MKRLASFIVIPLLLTAFALNRFTGRASSQPTQTGAPQTQAEQQGGPPPQAGAPFAFYDGRVSEELFREGHELAYEQLKEEQARAAETGAGRPGPSDSGGAVGRRPLEQGGD